MLMAGPAPDVWTGDAQEAWAGFLIEHEYHEVTLRVNG